MNMISLCIVSLPLLLFSEIVMSEITVDTKRDKPAECGDIIEGEFSGNFEYHGYKIKLTAGDSVEFNAKPLGQYLKMSSKLEGPTKQTLLINKGSNSHNREMQVEPNISSNSLSASGLYHIGISNYSLYAGDVRSSGGIGVYTLFINCILRDGTSILAGDKKLEQPPIPPEALIISKKSLFRFPGLAAVDFKNSATTPLPKNIPITGNKISKDFKGIIGFTFEAKTNERLKLNYKRQSGNINLGLVVLSRKNQVIFQSSLATSSALITDFTIPAGGEYILGFFRINLLDNQTDQETEFEVTLSEQ